MDFRKFILLFFVVTVCSGFTRFYISDSNSGAEQFYGKRKMKSAIHGHAFLNDLNTDLKCEGMVITTEFNTSKSSLASEGGKLNLRAPFARLKCNDERILELQWNLNNTIEAVDQFGKGYALKQVGGREYKRYIRVKKTNEKSKK